MSLGGIRFLHQTYPLPVPCSPIFKGSGKYIVNCTVSLSLSLGVFSVGGLRQYTMLNMRPFLVCYVYIDIFTGITLLHLFSYGNSVKCQ
jgi:hypothetical protein